MLKFLPTSTVWTTAEDQQKLPGLLYLMFWGFIVGAAAGAVIAIFRITSGKAYQLALHLTDPANGFYGMAVPVFLLIIVAALVTGLLIRNPAILFGGADWINTALEKGQKKPWLKILLPKFIGSWLVMACGISVGREGPCIQMGASTAMGLQKLGNDQVVKRRFFILGGSSAGLAAAFSAPFTGICYVYEVMKQKLDSTLFTFLLAGSLGVYVSVTQIFGLGVMLPFEPAPLPAPSQFFLLVPLGIFSSLVGIVYNLCLRASMYAYGKQKILPPMLRPMIVFLAAGLMLYIFPAITGEGLSVFNGMVHGQTLLGYLIFFLIAKMLFTAFCYGSGIPAGIMVPVLCLGGVAGGIYGSVLLALGLGSPELMHGFIVMGMAGAYTGAERAPLTGMMLVLEMTGTWNTALGMLLVNAIAVFTARVCRVSSV